MLKPIAAASLVLAAVTAQSPVQAQLQPAPALPNLSNVESLIKLKGTTVNMNVQDGSRSSLNFGSSTSMGVSVNMAASEGTKTSASSQLTPQSGSIEFSIGKGTTPGLTSAIIKNLRTETDDESGKTLGAEGEATLTGVTSSLKIELNPKETGFNARTETLHEQEQRTGTRLDPDGKPYEATYYIDADQRGEQGGGQNANASANSSINSLTNVDINTTTFTNVFIQAF